MNGKAGINPLAGKRGLDSILEAGKTATDTLDRFEPAATSGPVATIQAGFKIKATTPGRLKAISGEIQAKTGKRVNVYELVDEALDYYLEHWQEIRKF